jgi:MSHA type pilus biogenesis protein MshL
MTVGALTMGAISACASSATSHRVRTSVHVEPVPPAARPLAATTADAPAPPPALPPLNTAAQGVLVAAPERRISVFDVPAGTPIATAVSQLGNQLGLSVNVDPRVRGTAEAHLRNVTVDEALREIVSRNGAAYQLQGSMLRVLPIRMETRTFPLDYVAISRVGSMSTVLQRRLSSENSSPPRSGADGGNAFGPNSSAATGKEFLAGQSVADIWQEIRIALTGIISSGQPGQGVAALTRATDPRGAASIPFPDGSNLAISPMSGLISVTATPEKLALVAKFIGEFQASVLRQVMIEAKIVEVTLTPQTRLGIDWSVVSAAASGKYGVTLNDGPSVTTTGNTGNVNFTFTGGAAQINAIVNALQTQGDVNVLSNEQTSALNNQRAIFDVSTDEVFFDIEGAPSHSADDNVVARQSAVTPRQISVGVVLDVLPQISADNVLTMDIHPSVTNIDHVSSIRLADGTTASAPVVARREGDTTARLRAGETIVIGGLLQTRNGRTTNGVPFLRDLPLFGRAFQHISDYETRSELVVFLTPTIITGQPVPGR